MENELIGILAKYPEVYKLYSDKISIDLFDDQYHLEIISDITTDKNYTWFSLLAKYGDYLPICECSLSEANERAEIAISALINKKQLQNANQICCEFTKQYMSDNNPTIDGLIESINNISIMDEKYKVYGIEEVVNYLEQITSQPEPTINTIFGELKYGTVCYLGGRPGMWKSTACVNMMIETAKQHYSLMVSFEMSAQQICGWIGRIFTEQTEDDMKRGLTHGALESVYANTALLKNKLSVIDYPVMSVTAIERAIMRLRLRGKNVEVVYIDNLNLIQKLHKDEYQALSQITRDLKLLAKKLNIVVVCIAHLNREVAGRSSKKPRLADLRGSGTIEQDADYVVFLHRESWYLYESGSTVPTPIKKALEWWQAKNRWGNPLSGIKHISLEIGKQYGEMEESDVIDYNMAMKQINKKHSNSDF